MGWLIGITLLVFATVFVLLIPLLSRENEVSAARRLQDVENYYRAQDRGLDVVLPNHQEGSFYYRVIQPLAEEFSNQFKFISNIQIFSWLEEKIKMAGLSMRWTPWEAMVIWVGLVLTGGTMGLLFGLLKNVSLLKFLLMVVGGAGVGCGILPYYLYRKIRLRRKQIRQSLPDVLDMLTISVEAGLSFDSALVKLAEKMKGPLVEELSRVLQELRIGIPRKTALVNMAERCAVEDLSLFVSAIVQADQLGVGIARVLRIQSNEARDKRRMSVRELAMKAPIKMLFPLVFFVFPALFVVVLGPAVLSIIKTLTQ